MKLKSLWAVALPRLVRRWSKWAWMPELETLARIDHAQRNPPQGRVRMYCAGWRDKNMIGWGEYYLDSIHPTPEAATAAIESLREKHAWSQSRSTSCGQCVDVFFPANSIIDRHPKNPNPTCQVNPTSETQTNERE